MIKVGDKILKMTNTEDVTSIKIVIIDDILEVGLNENFIEMTYYNFIINKKQNLN